MSQLLLLWIVLLTKSTITRIDQSRGVDETDEVGIEVIVNADQYDEKKDPDADIQKLSPEIGI
jgi:hypothetical protein